MKKFLFGAMLAMMAFPKPVLASLGCEVSSLGYGFFFGVLFFVVCYLVMLTFSFVGKNKISVGMMLGLSAFFSFSAIGISILLSWSAVSVRSLVGFYVIYLLILFWINYWFGKKITILTNKQLFMVYGIVILVLMILWFGAANKLDMLFSRIYWWIYAGSCRGMQGGT